jgi:5-methylcytosine-specific restriction enzyme subunit McrC
VQIHRNNRLYDFALRLCRLIHENMMIEPGTGEERFRDFRADERQMGAVFEDFVRSFFRREQRSFRVSSPHIPWHDVRGTDHDLERLPIMRSDVVLESAERCIVLDTKFYHEPLTSRFGTRKVRSDHLYQILAYVGNRSASGNHAAPHEGMLLYPVVDEAFAFDYRLKGEQVKVRSLNLDQPWPAIHNELLRLIEA